MNRVRNSLLPLLLGGLIVLTSSVAEFTFMIQPVAALPVLFAANPGDLCQLPDDSPSSPTGTVLPDGYTCCPSKYTLPTSCLFYKYINPLVDLLSGLVGLAVVISIIYGGIEYITSTGDPQRAEAGKKRIIESLVGLAAFLLLFAFLQYVMPGGVFNGA